MMDERQHDPDHDPQHDQTLPACRAAPYLPIQPAREAVAIIQVSNVETFPGGPTVANPNGLTQPGARLPGRALRLLAGQPVIAHLIERVRKAGAVSRMVVALSVAQEDDALIAPARRAGAQIFRGSVHDQVSRLAGCADWLGLDDNCVVVRVHQDSPLVDPGYLDAGIAALRRLGAGALEFEEDRAEELCPGLGAAFLSVGTLRMVDGRARTPVHRSDVMTYIYEHPGEADLRILPLPEALDYLRGDHRLLLQSAEDLALHEAIYLRLYHGVPIDTAAAVNFLNADPVLASLNRGVLQRGMTLPLRPEVGWRGR